MSSQNSFLTSRLRIKKLYLWIIGRNWMCAMSSIRKTPRKVIVERWHGCDARARKFGMASESAILGQLQGPLNAIGSQALNRHRRSLVEPVLVEPCVGMILKGIFHGRMETIGSFRSFSFWGGLGSIPKLLDGWTCRELVVWAPCFDDHCSVLKYYIHTCCILVA